jgi:hypothetical protein
MWMSSPHKVDKNGFENLPVLRYLLPSLVKRLHFFQYVCALGTHTSGVGCREETIRDWLDHNKHVKGFAILGSRKAGVHAC